MLSAILVLAGAGAVFLGLVVAGRFLGFAAQRPADYAGTAPQFDVHRHLAGPMLCEGVIYGPGGRVVSRFVADMEGRWDGSTGVLTEAFRYDSGTAQDRTWRLHVGNDGSIRAEADDIIGTGLGQQIGAAMRLKYRLKLPESAGGWVLDVTDWMYLVDNGTVINRSQFRKFGFKVAELVATMRRVET
ncbi:DUF3833 domain-containing protein [Rhodobacteraceae bacterium WD3A24]|nr:DUF3833 domain-containing protein [Rhodobacteraceae bacterium WD3A24]